MKAARTKWDYRYSMETIVDRSNSESLAVTIGLIFLPVICVPCPRSYRLAYATLICTFYYYYYYYYYYYCVLS